MNQRSVLVTVVILLLAGAMPAVAQQKLGDLVAQGGYDWVIGKWVASTDDGQTVEFNLEWALDQYTLVNSIRLGEFRYQGMLTVAPAGDGAVDSGVDNRGGTWKGSWSEDPAGLVHRVEYTNPNGETRTVDMVISRGEAETITIALYPVDSSGARSSEPWGSKLTYKRQTAKPAAEVSAAAESSQPTDYEKLGDLVAEGGYEWLIGKWVATDADGRKYELEHKPILNNHAAVMDMKTGELKYSALIFYVPARQEVVLIGADNMGRTWKGTWEQGDAGPIHKAECTSADGTTIQKMQFVYSKGDGDVLKVREYPVDAGGSVASTPRTDLTFQRQKAPAKEK